MSNKVLIIGGCGFIGHNLAIYLKNKKFNVTVTDSLSVNNYFSHKKTNEPNKKFNLSVLKARQSLLKKNKINLIINDARNYKSTTKIINSLKKLFHI